MKKKLTKILLVVLVCSIFLIGCGKVESVEGTTWKIVESVNDEGKKFTGEEMEKLIGEITYEFKSEGVFVAGAAGQSVEGTWSQTDEYVILGSTDGKSYTATIDGDKMMLDNSGYKFTFEKK